MENLIAARKPSALATPWYHGWNIVAASILFQATSLGIVLYSFTLWVEPLMAEFAVSRAMTLTSITIVSAVLAIVSPFGGRLLDILPARVLIPAGMAMIAAGLLLASAVTALWQLWIIEGTLFAVGIAISGAMSAQVVVVRWFVHRRGLALGLSALGSSLGGFVFAPTIAFLMAETGWRGAFAILGLWVAVLTPFIWLVLRPRRSYEAEPERRDAKPAVAIAEPDQEASWTTKAILAEKRFWAIALGLTPIAFCFATIQYNMGAIGHDVGVPTQELAFILSIMWAAMIVGKILFGILLDYMHTRNVYWIAIGTTMIAVLMLSIVTDATTLIVLALLLGVSMGASIPLIAAFVAGYFGRKATGSVVGLISPFLFFANAGPALAGLIRDRTGSYDYVSYMLALSLLPGVLAMLFLNPAARASSSADGASGPAA